MGHFNTHAEAINEAQRLARRVTVTLPVRPVDTGAFWVMLNGTLIARKTHRDRATGIHLWVEPNELKPLALALLAHHYKNQKEQL